MFDAKTVKARIRYVSVTDGDETHHEYDGEYRRVNGSHCIAYTDYTGDAVTKIGIEAAEHAMLLHRVGYFTSDMLFDPQTETVVSYDVASC